MRPVGCTTSQTDVFELNLKHPTDGAYIRHNKGDPLPWTLSVVLRQVLADIQGINAEELGITSKNVDAMLKSKDPMVQRFLGVIEGNGKSLGLDEKWAYNIIKQVGNYSEIFERNVGVNTTLGLERGLNALWTNGGLLYSPPFK